MRRPIAGAARRQQTDLDFTRISEKLGFSEQSVMTRFAHRRLGASPTALRCGRGRLPTGSSGATAA